MNAIKNAIEQNNATVAFLQAQDLSRALNSSITALMESKRMHTHQISSSTTISSIATAHLDGCMLLSPINDETVDSDSSGAFVYEHGIVIPSKMMDQKVITPIVLFNAALTHHLVANESHCPRMLQRAKALYELAYDTYDMDHNILFQFAVINNIAVIERDMGRVMVSEECFEYLESLVMIFLADEKYSVHRRHVRGFHANIIRAHRNDGSVGTNRFAPAA